MSYGQRNSNVTMINELPELEELEGVGDARSREFSQKPTDIYQKYIRGSHQMVSQSGMNRMNMEESPPPQSPPVQNPPPQYPPPGVHMTYNCIDIARHIQDCPICSKFYNNDRTVYVIVIIVLSIMCLMLLKKVLDV